MAYKSLLTFQALGDSFGSLDQAIELARTSNAHLDIIVLGTLVSPPVVMHDVAPAAEWVQHNRDTVTNAVERVNEIEKYVADKSISATVTAECDYSGRLEKIAARYALCADAHVVTINSLKTAESARKAFNGTLFDSGCPVLLLPEETDGFDDLSKIAIAWNGRVEASRAVRGAMPLLKRADRVNIIVIDPVEADVGQDPGNDLAAYLARYGLKITVDVLAGSGMTVVEKLMQRTTDIDADLLVMGGYGHTKFREWLLGGTTYDMLEGAQIPVLMVH